jgi:APA family basic amino acid/polyamine antiporter
MPKSKSDSESLESGTLRREIGVLGATLIGLGSVLGTGVFASIGIGAGIAGPAVIVAIVLAAALALCKALSSAQLAASHPVSRGTYEYGNRLVSCFCLASAGMAPFHGCEPHLPCSC